MTHFTLAHLRHDTPQAQALLRQRLLNTPQPDHHGLLWSLFNQDPDAKRDFLFKVGEEGRFLIVSARAPTGDPALWHLQTKAYAPKLKTGQRYGFALRANPTIALSQPGRARSKRVDVVMHAKPQSGKPLKAQEREKIVLDWLESKMRRQHGAALDYDLCQLMVHQKLKIPRKGSAEAHLSMVDIDGVLTVTDAPALEQALLNGIGHGKAFGLGLLLLRPL